LSVNTSLSRFGVQLASIPEREVDFARLSRQQKLLDDISTLLQTRLKEAEIKEAVEPGDVRIVDSALLPEKPIAPKPWRNLAIAVVLGFGLGVASALVREATNTRVRTKDDLISAVNDRPLLATIPGIHETNGKVRRWGKTRRRDQVAEEEKLLAANLVTHLDPKGVASEAYRVLRTNITFANVERPVQVIAVASAVPGDGKSTTAANLAITLAQQGARTLLIDGDLRKGVLRKLFGVPAEPGLTHVLVGRASLEAAIHSSPLESGTRLDLIPAGVFPPNPAELLGSSRMREVIGELRKRYDYIVFDTAPLNLVTDAAILGTLMDTMILVVRADKTDKRALQHAVSQLDQLRVPVGGIVLNDFDLAKAPYAYAYGYGYSYGYGYHYGST
jgi:capsular exopolysaccharide synthesis family protein